MLRWRRRILIHHFKCYVEYRVLLSFVLGLMLFVLNVGGYIQMWRGSSLSSTVTTLWTLRKPRGKCLTLDSIYVYIFFSPPCGFKRCIRPALSSRSSQFHWKLREAFNNDNIACDVLYSHTHQGVPGRASNSQEDLTMELVIKGWIGHLKVDEEEREFQAERTVWVKTQKNETTEHSEVCVCVCVGLS